MNDAKKTKAQLIEELTELRRQVSEHRVSENEPRKSQRREILWEVQYRLRSAVAKMQRSDDIQHVLSVLREGLRQLEISFQDCGINLVDPHRDPAVRSLNSLGREGEWVLPEQAWGQDFVLQMWKDGVPVYRRDLATEDTFNERNNYPKYFGHPVRSVLDVPFAYGTLAINSKEPDAFTEGDIADLTRLTMVLEEGFRRREDLDKLEKRNQELRREITEHIQVENALRESEERYRLLFENTSVGIGIADLQGHLITFNDAMLRPGGHSREEIGKIDSIADLYFDADKRAEALILIRDQGFLHQHEMQFKCKDGTPYDALLSLQPVQIQGQSCWQATVEDITARKRTEGQLKENERLLNRLYETAQEEVAQRRRAEEEVKNALEMLHDSQEAASIGAWWVTVPDEEIYWTPEIFRIFDIDSAQGPLSTEEFLGYIYPEDLDLVQQKIQEQRAEFDGSIKYSYRIQLPNGEIKTLEHIGRQIRDAADELIRTTGTIQDITDRRQVEETLEEEYRSHDADNAIRLAVASINEPQDLERVLAEVSIQLTQLGVIHDDCSLQIVTGDGTGFFTVGSHLSESADWSRFWDELHCVAQDGTLSFRHPPDEELPEELLREKQMVINVWKKRTFRYEPCTPEGLGFVPPGMTIVDVAFSHGTLAINRKQPHAFGAEDIALLQRFAQIISEGFQRVLDITERKQTEETLRESEEKLRLLVERLPIGVTHNTPDGQFLVYNPHAQNMTGYTLQELSAMKAQDLYVHPEDRKDLLRNLEEKGEHTYEYPLRRKDGREIIVRGTTRAIKNSEGELIELQGYSEDITERRKMQRELIRLERLRAVGELSAGVSHNLNNILTSVLGPAQLLKRKTDDPDLLREADDIIASTCRARDLVRELHLSVRNVEEESLFPVSVDLVVQQAVQTSRPRWKDQPEAQGVSIEMVTEWGGVPPIRGTDVGLHAIFTNLIFNAVDAMPEGGMITIRTEGADGQVQITFSDTGMGMDEETRRRVFEPFFTTKMNVGTGLGLSTAYNTVTGWGGTMEVDSTPGEGTKFTLRFPASQS
ncbi:MAG: PAS domain S-box protein [Gemmatimonadetes bacterium]|nr:PAS domain S-box protein [Gemmatimonadota bacterium]MBT7915766.1 PAS domain S-box protein [Candidatus Bathyarchaeota archaeon]